MSHLFFGHIFVSDFFDDDYPEVVETVTGSSEMLVDANSTIFLCIISVFVDPSMGLLFLQLANILFLIAFFTECQINGIF